MNFLKRVVWVVGVLVCLHSGAAAAAEAQPDMAIFVIDSSQAEYGNMLRDDVWQIIRTQFPAAVISGAVEPEHKEQRQQVPVFPLEKGELHHLTERLGVTKVSIVEILPAMVTYRQILFSQRLQAKATLRICVYDSASKQYVLAEDIHGDGDNQTYLPYSSIGTKPAVREATVRAMEKGVKKLQVLL